MFCFTCILVCCYPAFEKISKKWDERNQDDTYAKVSDQDSNSSSNLSQKKEDPEAKFMTPGETNLQQNAQPVYGQVYYGAPGGETLKWDWIKSN